MRDLMLLVDEVIGDLDAIGIEYGNIVEWTINYRAKSRWGQCRKVGNNFYINISVDLLDDNIDEFSAKNTIAHEILHTCKGCMNHGYEWQRLARMVNDCYYNYNISRCTSSEEKGIERVHKYNFVCNNCGYKIGYDRATKFVRRYSHGYGCGRCHAKNCWEMV